MMRSMICGIVLLISASQAMALGLGAIRPQSGLNQPFLAMVPINSANEEELESLQISLGNRSQFQQAGVSRPFFLAQLKFQILKGDQDSPYIKIYSRETIKEPFLEFLVEYQWNRGKLLQKYTVLLDPVGNTDTRPSMEQAVTANIPTQNTPQPVDTPVAVTDPAPQASPTPPAAAATIEAAPVTQKPQSPSASEYGPVSPTDTLWSIAKATRPNEEISIQQMMLAILHSNPAAFSSPNVGSLRQGKILSIPTLAEILQIDKTTALEEIKSQYKNTTK